MNQAWNRIDELARELIFKAGPDGDLGLSHAQRVAKILSTPEGRRLYEEGRGSHGKDYSILQPKVEKRETISKRDAAWDRIKVAAERIEKSDPLRRKSFASCVDQVLRQSPELYEAYRSS